MGREVPKLEELVDEAQWHRFAPLWARRAAREALGVDPVDAGRWLKVLSEAADKQADHVIRMHTAG